jgi:hypothetical protein
MNFKKLIVGAGIAAATLTQPAEAQKPKPQVTVEVQLAQPKLKLFEETIKILNNTIIKNPTKDVGQLKPDEAEEADKSITEIRSKGWEEDFDIYIGKKDNMGSAYKLWVTRLEILNRTVTREIKTNFENLTKLLDKLSDDEYIDLKSSDDKFTNLVKQIEDKATEIVNNGLHKKYSKMFFDLSVQREKDPNLSEGKKAIFKIWNELVDEIILNNPKAKN